MELETNKLHNVFIMSYINFFTETPEYQDIHHSFDLWHLAKNVSKRVHEVCEFFSLKKIKIMLVYEINEAQV